MWGIPRSSWDYSWGRPSDEYEVKIQPDVIRDYCPKCDKKCVHEQGMCLGCKSNSNSDYKDF
jgi:hypothetical protein